MLNRDTFQTDPAAYRLANQGVAQSSFPPTPEAMETLRGELSTFVCEGAYANGLSRILEAFLGSIGKAGGSPAVWISGFYGSGKSHLASMLAALWTLQLKSLLIRGRCRRRSGVSSASRCLSDLAHVVVDLLYATTITEWRPRSIK